MEKTTMLIKQFFEGHKWPYKFNEEKGLISAKVKMNNVLGIIRVLIIISDTSYVVSAILGSNAEKEYFNEVAEYLHRANAGMRNGNFEFDYNDGQVRFKSYVNFKRAELSPDIVEDSIQVPLAMFDAYGKNLIRVMVGDGTPAELIEDTEKKIVRIEINENDVS